MTVHGASAPPRGVRWGPATWIGILLAIGAVQVVRAQWFDAAVFFAVSLVLAVDAMRGRPRDRSRGESQSRRNAPPGAQWVLAVAAVVGVVACVLPRQSLAMQVLVCAAGAAAVLVAWPRRSLPTAPWPPGPRRLAWSWAVILVVGCLWELAQFILGQMFPQDPAFALSNLLDPILSTWPGRLVFVVLWIAGGFFLVRRGRA